MKTVFSKILSYYSNNIQVCISGNIGNQKFLRKKFFGYFIVFIFWSKNLNMLFLEQKIGIVLNDAKVGFSRPLCTEQHYRLVESA